MIIIQSLRKIDKRERKVSQLIRTQEESWGKKSLKNPGFVPQSITDWFCTQHIKFVPHQFSH